MLSTFLFNSNILKITTDSFLIALFTFSEVDNSINVGVYGLFKTIYALKIKLSEMIRIIKQMHFGNFCQKVSSSGVIFVYKMQFYLVVTARLE